MHSGAPMQPVLKMAPKALGLAMRKNSRTDTQNSGQVTQAGKFMKVKVHS